MVSIRPMLLLLLLLPPDPASACRLHSIWHYPWPQRCAAPHPPALMRPAPAQVALQTPASAPVTSVTLVTAADERGPRMVDLDALEIQLEQLWLRRAALIYPDLPQ